MTVTEQLSLMPPALAPDDSDIDAAQCRVVTVVRDGGELDERVTQLVRESPPEHPARHLGWMRVLRRSLGHHPFLVEATYMGRTVGVLPLALIRSPLFGRFLVSLPFVNSAGITAESDEAAKRLVDAAVTLADQHDVRYLELRSECELRHRALTQKNDTKVMMRLPLPPAADQLWNGFKSKLRSQIKAGEKHPFEIRWGHEELLKDYYAVFSRNMRDLGTPVFPRGLFAAILDQFQDNAELCVVQLSGKPVASALLTHGLGITEVPSASTLREFNPTNVNMVMYWHLLQRAIQRRQQIFDFGRSTVDSNTYRFKKQWGAQPCPSVWQYYVRRGTIGDMRPTNARFSLAIRAWQRLPVWLTRLIGPALVRGIP